MSDTVQNLNNLAAICEEYINLLNSTGKGVSAKLISDLARASLQALKPVESSAPAPVEPPAPQK